MDSKCRLCLSSLAAEVNDSRYVTLFDHNDRPHLVVDKLRQFVNLNIHPQDPCSKKVCRNCVMNLDFCIQYVDRCRRVNQMVNQNESPETIVDTITSHYPYLYKSTFVQSENPQTVPFQMGQFFGPTVNLIGTEDPKYEFTSQQQQNAQQIIRHARTTDDINVDNNMVVEVEPNSILSPNKRSTRSITSVVATSNIKKDPKKMRKILPKQSDENSSQVTIAHPSAVKTSNGLFMMPVTIMTQCKTCNESIKANNVQDIQNHICSTKQQKSISCSEDGCKKKFYTQVTLRYHLKHYHRAKNVESREEETNNDASNQDGKSDNKKFKCTWPNCSKAYSAKSFLVEHHRMHTGDRPYACATCGKTFSRVIDVKKHQLLKVCL